MPTEEIDAEWELLVMEAKNIGLTVKEVRDFIHSPKDRTFWGLFLRTGEVKGNNQ